MALTIERGEDRPSAPARFAQAVRELAHDAHRTLRRSPSPADLRKLSQRIEVLSAALGDHRDGPLGSWLDSAGREVRSAAVRRAGSYRPMCVCA